MDKDLERQKIISNNNFAPYKSPNDLYNQIINALAVKFKRKRDRDGKNCLLEQEYRKFKKNGFPQVGV